MARALKVMTFNLQQLPWLGRVIGGAPVVGTPGGAPEPDPIGRARAIVRAILDLPAREQPDVVAFNEAFSETARKHLVSRLKAKYPHLIAKLEHPGPDVEEDSGLMLFSKLPFLPLPNGDDHIFEPFKQGAGTDALAAKGVAIVRVNGPFAPTTIAFTHLQASYDAANTEHADIRADQLAFVHQQLRDLAAGNLQHFADAVIVGDLNIKGDPDDTTGERNLVFAPVPETFGGDFDDAWRVSMHPPGDLKDYDPGYTQRDTPTYQPNRFDYQCVRRNANVDIGLVAHHMSTPIRLPSEITDHWACQAHLHRMSPHCSPALAVDLLATKPVNDKVPESPVWIGKTEFHEEDMFHWIYLAAPGTFSIFLSPQLEAHAFRRNDFTRALAPTDTLNLLDLPGNLGALVDREHQLDPKGVTFSWREPFFLRLRGRLTTFAGQAPFGIVQHRGESLATAHVLHPHLAVDPHLPLGQKLGTTDRCFFRADRPDRFSTEPYEDRFQLRNRGEVDARIEILDAVGNVAVPPSKAGGSAPNLHVTRTQGQEKIFIVLERANVADTQFEMFWDSPLCYLNLDESLRLHVDDETGLDWPGEDEFALSVTIDGENVYDDAWDDADSGEDWPGLAQAIRQSVQARTGNDKWVAFTSDITWDVLKTDGIAAHGSELGIVHALDASDDVAEARTAGIVISDSASDGHLTAHTSLSKFPPV